MGRGKVELKRIEDKSSRQVRFAKRRRGLMKKAHELSVLCDVEVAVFIFSGRDRLYEFSSGDSLRKIVDRYQNHRSAEEVVRNAQDIHGDGSCRPDDWQKVEQLDMTELTRLEHQLDAITRQTRIRKTRLLMEAMTALHEKEIQIIEKELTAAINETDDHQVPPPSPPPPLPLPPGFWN